MKAHTVYKTFSTARRRQFVRITVFYCEFDGQRPKRLIIKVMGE